MESSEGLDDPDTFSGKLASVTSGVSDLKFIGSVGTFESSMELLRDNHSEMNGISSLAAESNMKQEPVANYVVLDEVSQVFDLACLCIKNAKVIGLSMEGLNVGQLGEPSWMQISLENCTFLFDMVALGDKIFEEGLKEIIEDGNIVKVVHNCRPVSRYLRRRHNLNLMNVFDIQVADIIVYKQRNSGQFPAKCSSLLACLMEYLSIPAEVFSRDYMKFVIEDSTDVWRARPAKDGVFEAAVFKVYYLPRLRLKMIEMMLLRFRDGCDVYLGLMRDVSDSHVQRVESQMHLVPSELQNLAYRAPISRQCHETLQKREKIFLYSHDSNIFTKQECSSTFFKGEGALYELHKHNMVPRSEGNLLGQQVELGDEEEDDDNDEFYNDEENKLIGRASDCEYEMLMHDITNDPGNNDEKKNNSANDIDKNILDGDVSKGKTEFLSKVYAVDLNQNGANTKECLKGKINLSPTVDSTDDGGGMAVKASNSEGSSLGAPVCISEILSKTTFSSSTSDVHMVPAGHEQVLWKCRNQSGSWQSRGGIGRRVHLPHVRGSIDRRCDFKFKGEKNSAVHHECEHFGFQDAEGSDLKCDENAGILDMGNVLQTKMHHDSNGSKCSKECCEELEKEFGAGTNTVIDKRLVIGSLKFVDNLQKSTALSHKLITKCPRKSRQPQALMQKRH